MKKRIRPLLTATILLTPLLGGLSISSQAQAEGIFDYSHLSPLGSYTSVPKVPKSEYYRGSVFNGNLDSQKHSLPKDFSSGLYERVIPQSRDVETRPVDDSPSDPPKPGTVPIDHGTNLNPVDGD